MADAHDRAMSLAWHVAGFQRADKLPELKTLLTKPPMTQKALLEQHRNVMLRVSAQYGIPLRRVRLVRRES